MVAGKPACQLVKIRLFLNKTPHHRVVIMFYSKDVIPIVGCGHQVQYMMKVIHLKMRPEDIPGAREGMLSNSNLIKHCIL